MFSVRSWSSHYIIVWNFGGQTILIVHDLLLQTNAFIDIYNLYVFKQFWMNVFMPFNIS